MVIESFYEQMSDLCVFTYDLFDGDGAVFSGRDVSGVDKGHGVEVVLAANEWGAALFDGA